MQITETKNDTKKAYTKQDIIRIVNQVSAEVAVPPHFMPRLQEMTQAGKEVSDDLLAKTVAMFLELGLSPEQKGQLQEINDALVNRLKSYKVSGFSFAFDPNGAFFVDTQNPQFTVTYKDAHGNVKTRTYLADISLLGLNLELAFRFNLIFFTNTDANFYDTDKQIQLGTGFQFTLRPFVDNRVTIQWLEQMFPGGIAYDWPSYGRIIAANLSQISITYAPFVNAPGGMFILGYSYGASWAYASIINGGTLTPVAVTTK